MMGLDKVQGPHWSQILSLYGVGGSISNILKDRSQVQLKDKARNLKLFFLKSNSEMPYYLQAVTGELKTRAPSQAARKEAEEKARHVSEEAVGPGHRPQGYPGMAGHHVLQASPHQQQQQLAKAAPVNPHAFHALQQATQAMNAQAAAATPGTPILPAVAPMHHALAPSPATVSAITSAVSHAHKTEHVPLAPHPGPAAMAAAASSAQQAPATPTAGPAHYTPPLGAQTPHHHHHTPTPTAHTPVQSYTPSHSYTPTQPAPTASPHLQASPAAHDHHHAVKTEPNMLAEAAADVGSSLFGLGDDHDDLRDAALMQSMRELEAYSGTSVS